MKTACSFLVAFRERVYVHYRVWGIWYPWKLLSKRLALSLILLVEDLVWPVERFVFRRRRLAAGSFSRWLFFARRVLARALHKDRIWWTRERVDCRDSPGLA